MRLASYAAVTVVRENGFASAVWFWTQKLRMLRKRFIIRGTRKKKVIQLFLSSVYRSLTFNRPLSDTSSWIELQACWLFKLHTVAQSVEVAAEEKPSIYLARGEFVVRSRSLHWRSKYTYIRAHQLSAMNQTLTGEDATIAELSGRKVLVDALNVFWLLSSTIVAVGALPLAPAAFQRFLQKGAGRGKLRLVKRGNDDEQKKGLLQRFWVSSQETVQIHNI